LRPTYDHHCVPINVEGDVIEVSCSYNFKVHEADVELAEAHIKYHVIYKLLGEEPTTPSDIEEFARANGAYHSWPFVRESIYSLTGRMGFPPYTLPVLSFLRQKPTSAAAPASATPTVPPSEATDDASQPKSSEASE